MRFYKVLFVFYLFLSCNNEGEQLPFYISPDFTPTFEEPKTGSHKIKNFVFTNQDGLPFGSDNLNGKIHIANFMFTSCTNICPIMTTNMTEVEKMFANNQNIQLVSFTVTPWIDNPDLLKRYKDRKSVV